MVSIKIGLFLEVIVKKEMNNTKIYIATYRNMISKRKINKSRSKDVRNGKRKE